MGEVIPLRPVASVPKTRGIRIYLNSRHQPVVRYPEIGRVGTRIEQRFATAEHARDFAAALAAEYGWAISDEIDGGGRAA